VAKELASINSEQKLTRDQYLDLADVPPELEWLANITNLKTRRGERHVRQSPLVLLGQQATHEKVTSKIVDWKSLQDQRQ
jgi:hypothetical protein